MSAYGATELANAFRTVRKNTVQLAEDIPEDKYDFVPAPGMQNVGQMLKHIAFSPLFHDDMHAGPTPISSMKGYDFPAIFGKIGAEEAKPMSKSDIVATLTSEGERFASWLGTLTPEFLEQTVSDPSGSFTRSRMDMLLGAKEHEMHHRAQLMLVQRMLGIVPHLTRAREERARQTATAS